MAPFGAAAETARMETFIVRFYRRALRPMRDVAGTVEHVGSGERAGFDGEQELLARLLKGAASGEPPPIEAASAGAAARPQAAGDGLAAADAAPQGAPRDVSNAGGDR
jgi:hypothetical protein